MKRLCIFYHNTGSLGHARIVYSLVKAIAAQAGRKIGITVIETGEKKIQLFPVNLYAQTHFIPMRCGSHDWSRALMRKTNMIRPHVFLTEQYPFFRHPEHKLLLPVLLDLRSSGTITVSSTTHMDWTDTLHSFLPKAYDMILYHRPKTEIRAYKHYLSSHEQNKLESILKVCRKMLFPTGFIYDHEKEDSFRDRKESRRRSLSIVVSRGGLAENACFIHQCLKLALKRKDWHFTISMGAMAFPRNLRRLLGRLDNLDYFSWSYPGFENSLRSADISLNLAGYNTMVFLLRHKIPTLILPVKTAEQRWIAEFLKQHLAARIINTHDTTAEYLENMIVQLQKEKHLEAPAVPDDWFNGASRSADLILEHL